MSRETSSHAQANTVAYSSPQTVEISDDDEDLASGVANSASIPSTNGAARLDLPSLRTMAWEVQSHDRGPTSDASQSASLGKRKRAAQASVAEEEDEDVQVISALPDSSTTRPRSKGRAQVRSHISQEGRRNRPEYADAIDLDLLPDIRPRSPDGTTHYLYNSYTDLQPFQASHRDYGSASQPIDLENYTDNGEGPSRSQIVNGQAVGTFSNGRYIPYRPQTPPYLIPGAPISRTSENPGPSNLYDWDRDINGQRLIEVFRQQRSAQHAQGHIPPPRSLQEFNAHSRQNIPIDYTSERSRFHSQYQEAYDQNQISAEDLNNLLANISDKDIPPEQRVPNPVGLTKYLMEHQRVGLTWLIATESGTNKGGILADAMGLGKTIQAIAIMLSRPSEDKLCKSTLVVAPVALLRQWEREIRTMTFPSPSIYIHHGPKKFLKSSEVTKFDVVLTSFNTIGYEEAAQTRYDENLAKLSTDAGELPACPMLNTKWYRVILDEAHCIKNKATRSAKGCCNLQATHRWALTGTPMQNSVEELYSLISFLRIKPYNDHKAFTRDIAKPLTSKNTSIAGKATKKIQALLTAIMLRRTKDSQIDGRAILQLPEKHSIVDDVIMNDEERDRYTELETGVKKALQRIMKHDRNATGSNMLVLLLKLRQTCNHFLLSGREEKDITVLGKAEGAAVARTLRPEVVHRLKEASTSGFECPVCLDIVTQGVTIVVPCGHYYCAECLVQAMEVRNPDNEEDELARCPQCRGSFDLHNCINLKHFEAAHCPERFDEPDLDDEVSNGKVESPGEDNVRAKFLLNFKDKGKQKQRVKSSHRNGAEPRLSTAQFSDKYNMTLDEFTSSAKMEKILALLLDIRTTRPGEKTIVFSQFTSFLDLVEIPLIEFGIRFLRYDGSLSAEQRNSALVRFEEDVDVNVILVSLKAGNVGLNLTCANHVILSEPFYNPYVEDQAIDRAHRIGQQREVFVHRLIIKDSVESRVLAIQNRKRTLIEGAMDASQSAAITKLGKREIAYLFGLGSL
ncbi:putative SWI/SNF family DNA-dependent ATPase Ris1 [Taphrina deformans PYCC 5710]|uniref:SWI/SNF family DNA-dependent ATPase Ris1 n=1 Tax=Taphrina deformans (strain PYCC 5710 / ATCC 11124 / CBS 356.35 / IMI 108563 / JCM 9778 / NBRC 8474) TaxID=1097556 RepID=R4XCI9_TAPDE|nr:putative SWI/SNF family DNA-dependent ATPase Ris1 [Taphrina deformans PYCC 5710]|eukprot:CCG83604.1 putative SWI/SNF family DNA-dependent ATPase Ris1 [Taphrina deformans PYCC 5710]